MKELVELLIEKKKTISTMESCTDEDARLAKIEGIGKRYQEMEMMLK